MKLSPEAEASVLVTLALALPDEHEIINPLTMHIARLTVREPGTLGAVVVTLAIMYTALLEEYAELHGKDPIDIHQHIALAFARGDHHRGDAP